MAATSLATSGRWHQAQRSWAPLPSILIDAGYDLTRLIGSYDAGLRGPSPMTASIRA